MSLAPGSSKRSGKVLRREVTDATSGYLIRAAQLIGRDGLERESLASLYGHLVLLDQSSDLDIARLVRDKVGQLHLKLGQCRSAFGGGSGGSRSATASKQNRPVSLRLSSTIESRLNQGLCR